MIWNESKECMGRDELAALQGYRLSELVKKMYNVGYYKKKMQSIGLEPEDIRGIEDLDKLPFTTSKDLFENFPYGTFAVPRSEIAQYHFSVGNTDAELIEGYTENDIGVWGEFMARCFSMAGLGRTDTIQAVSGYGHSTSSCSAEYGAAKIGASFVASSLGMAHRLVTAMKLSQATCMIGTPLCLKQVAREMKQMDSLSLKAVICSEKALSEKKKRELESMLRTKIFEIYGQNELTGSGIACECECHQGMHIQEDLFLTELLDTDTLTEAAEGASGEFVFTTLQKEGVPFIRYRTNDLLRITRKKCACGRTFARITRIERLTGGAAMIRGNKVYLYKLESALEGLQQADASYLVRIDNANTYAMDEVEVMVKLKDYGVKTDAELKQLKAAVQKAVGNLVGVKPSVNISGQDAHKEDKQKDEKKAVIVEDNRTQ